MTNFQAIFFFHFLDSKLSLQKSYLLNLNFWTKIGRLEQFEFLNIFATFFNLSVPHVSIAGDKEMHVEDGSSVVLKCTVSDYLKRPTYIFWYLNEQRLVPSQDIGIEDNVQSSSSKLGIGSQSWMDSRQDSNSLFSILSVREANGKFSGKYSCVPDNLRPASINVHVILGE